MKVRELEGERSLSKSGACRIPSFPFDPGRRLLMTQGRKDEVAGGVIGIALVVVLSGVGYLASGVGWLLSLNYPVEWPISLVYSIWFVCGGILMILVGRGLVHLKWWGLWGAITMLAVTLLVILINPFATLQFWDEPIVRIGGAAVFFILICYLLMPATRSKFPRSGNSAL